MSTIETYPNPVRIFTEARNQWFFDILKKFKIPIHVFTSIRESQLGQLMFAIESMRIKKLRDGEDPGTSIFDGEQIDMFVPVFQTFKSLEDFIAKEEVTFSFEDLKEEITSSDEVKQFLDNNLETNEWFSPLEFTRLDEVYLPAIKVFTDVILKIFDDKLEDDESQNVYDKIGKIDEGFSTLVKNLYDENIHKAIVAEKYTLDEKDPRIRLIEQEEGDPIQLNYNDYYYQVATIRGLILEILRRFKEGKKYSRKFEFIPEIFTLDMLFMLPQPDKSRIPVVKTHLATLKEEFKKKKIDTPLEFFSILSQNYNAFTLVFDPHQRMFQKALKNQEKGFKQIVRQYWRRMELLLVSEQKKIRENAELNLSLLWSYFRIIQAQAQHMSQNPEDAHDHQNMVYRMMLRFEHMFWQPGKKYTESKEIETKNHFWLAFAKIVNFEVRTPKDSVNLFRQLEDLYSNSKVLSNKTKRKKFGVTLRDHRSILKTIISYGVESRDPSIFNEIKQFNTLYEKVLVEIEAEVDQHPEISLEEEKRIVEQITAYVNMPVESFPAPEEADPRRRSARRIRQ